MHELWVCKSILRIIEQHSNSVHRGKIKKIYIEVGQLAAINHQSLIMSFNLISKGTVAEQATLEIIDIPAQASCDTCHKLFPIHYYDDQCQHCGNQTLTIKQGEELRVKSIEVL